MTVVSFQVGHIDRPQSDTSLGSVRSLISTRNQEDGGEAGNYASVSLSNLLV